MHGVITGSVHPLEDIQIYLSTEGGKRLTSLTWFVEKLKAKRFNNWLK